LRLRPGELSTAALSSVPGEARAAVSPFFNVVPFTCQVFVDSAAADATQNMQVESTATTTATIVFALGIAI
jgi:hypothetical protein